MSVQYPVKGGEGSVRKAPHVLFLITRRTNYPNLFFYKTLHVSGIFYAHHQGFSTVHSTLVIFMQVE